MTQLTLRLTKGSGLTNAEVDENFIHLDGRANTIQAEIDDIADNVIPSLSAATTNSLAGKQPINGKLTSLSSVSTNGMLSVSNSTITPRFIVPGSVNVVITNGDGVSGNPTIDLGSEVITTTNSKTLTNKVLSGTSNQISNISLTQSVIGVLPISKGGTNASSAAGVRSNIGALISPTGTGIVVSTGTDQTAVRQLEVSGVGLSVSNGPGVAGNPVVTSNATNTNTPSTIVSRDSSGNFSAGTITATLNGNATSANTVLNGVYTTGNQTIAGTKTFSSSIIGNLTGDVVGNVTGNVTGNLTGNADTVTNGVYTSVTYSNPTWLSSIAGSKVTSIPNSSLQNSSVTINGVTVALGSSVSIPQDYLPITPLNTANTIVARDSSGNFSAGRMTGNVTGNVTGNLAGNSVGTHNGPVIGNVTGNLTGNVTGTASGNVSRGGDTMFGYLSLAGNPTQPLHAVPKQYLDSREYVFTSGNVQYTNGFTNQVGSWNDGANFFDVYPPAGKSMGNLVAFIPSIAIIHYAGGVDGNDSIRCYWTNLGNRIRVYVQNTEQRSTPAANWLAVWR